MTVADYRAALNQWAENTLPGSAMWSEDLLESHKVFRRVYPFNSLAVSAAAGLGAAYAAEALMQPAPGNIIVSAVSGLVVLQGLRVQHSVKRFYDSIGYGINRGNLPALIRTAEGEPLIGKLLDLYVKDHDLQREYEAARIVNEVMTRRPSFG